MDILPGTIFVCLCSRAAHPPLHRNIKAPHQRAAALERHLEEDLAETPAAPETSEYRGAVSALQ